MYKHILVPVDGSPLALAAARQACGFAGETGARVTFYCAMAVPYPPPTYADSPSFDVATLELLRDASRRRARQALDEALQLAADAGLTADSASDESDPPGDGIIAMAEAAGCDLIFMASHGYGRARALLLGSETQRVLSHCKIPVLVFRQGPD